MNEENPMIDKLLREALDTRIVNRFLGYQGGAEVVDKQVYALWNVLQKRKFRYSSVSNTSLSSNVVFHSVCARSMMLWSPRKSTVWMGVSFLLLYSVP